MITITNNQEGKDKNTIKVTKSAYDSFYKRLGYSVVEQKKAKEIVSKTTPEPVTKVEEELDNFTIEDNLENKEEKKTSKRKGISNE